MRMKRREDEKLDIVKSTWSGGEDGKTRSWISSCRLHEDEKMKRRDKKIWVPYTCDLFPLLLFSSSSSRFDDIQDLVLSSSNPHQVDFTRSRILSSCLLVLMKSTWRYSVSRLVVFSSPWSWLDKIKDLVILSSRPNQVYLNRASISLSRLFFLMKLTWQDPGSCLLVFSSKSSPVDLEPISCLLVFSSSSSRIAEIQDLVLLSSRPEEVDFTRSRILSFRLIILVKLNWWDPGSRLLVFSSSSSQLDEIQDLVFLSFVLKKSTFEDLVFLSYHVFWGHL